MQHRRSPACDAPEKLPFTLHLLGAALIRSGLQIVVWTNHIQEVPLVSNAYSSVQAAAEGAYLRSTGLSPYAGTEP